MVLIKDNHLRAYGIRKKTVNNESVIRGIIKEARENVQRNIKIEIEVESLNEAKYALQEAPDIIMLDNMQPEDVRKAVKLRAEMGLEERVKLEVSGGITLSNVREYAETGIDMISSGSLTASIASIDYSMEIVMRDNQ
jgi:nicotinate-nucleotide pyrophosphorylase (carboxylating)